MKRNWHGLRKRRRQKKLLFQGFDYSWSFDKIRASAA